ncbi:hypothetical protein ATHL_03678 [Anaerolinea thermolimosa]|uniref:Uncharacterized protein n=1 Tax=Anaerolinea thermolimosa TaxID=229919 RepID=A0A7U9KMV1_9CHLR|nr:hypothetical protein [Anaerolinea thermolimosa]GAP08769.1 hypothetical protein ATHL_03678 [Anaerolinea thermolimosa]
MKISGKLSRRRFLQIAGMAGGGLAAASLAGYAGWNALDALPEPRPAYRAESESSSSGGPLLILHGDGADTFSGEYLGEMLRAEGLPWFASLTWDALGETPLENFAAILLAGGAPDRAGVEKLTAYVSAGGQLVIFKPDRVWDALLGLERLGGVYDGGYLQVNLDHPWTTGMESAPLLFHGEADLFRPAGCEVIAWLADDSARPTPQPAVTVRALGRGRAAAWALDLPRSVALSRQGNPAWANQERDGRAGIRAVDAFVGWMDLERLDIPHADEQMRLLGRMLTMMVMERLPLPRLHYFPAGSPGLLIATGDSHQNTPQVIEEVLSLAERFGGRMSVYHTPPMGPKWRRVIQRGRAELAEVPALGAVVSRGINFPTPAQVAGWRQRGHEFGVHPYVEEGLEAGWRAYLKSFLGYGYGPVPPTARTHRILWSGWVETARVQAAFGIGMNMDFYHYGTAFQKASGEWVYGFFNGSGLPMKFVDEEGRLLTIYQQVTQLVDEHLMKMPWGGGWAGLNADQAVGVAESLLRRASAVGAAVAAQFHVDPFAFEEPFASNARRFMEGSLKAAVERGLPIWTAEAWYRFAEARQQARMSGWQADVPGGSFSLELADALPAEVAILFPLHRGGARLQQIQVGGVEVAFTTVTQAGMEFGQVLLRGGRHQIDVRYGESG